MNNRIMAMLFALVAAMFISIVPVKAEAATCTGSHVDTYEGGNGRCDVCGEHVHRAITHAKVDATCAAEGNVKYFTCNFCDAISTNQNFTSITTLDKVKTPRETTHTVASYVNQGARQHWGECTVCGTTVKENHSTQNDCVCDAIGCNAAVHALSEVPAVAANHAAGGNIAHFKCSRTACGKLFADRNGATELKAEDVVTEIVAHDLQWTVTDDTHKHACTGCGYVPVAEAAHAYTNAGDNVVRTETQHIYTCTVEGCGHELAEDHYDEDENCVCDRCGYEQAHTYDGEYGKNDQGHKKECSVCGQRAELEEHDWEWVITDETHKKYCTVCEFVGAAEAGHEFEYKANGATHVVTCKHCEYEDEVDHIDEYQGGNCKCDKCGAVVHHLELVEAVAAKCKAEGNVAYYECQRSGCGLRFTDAEGTERINASECVIEATGHKHDKVVFDDEEHWLVCTNTGCEDVKNGSVEGHSLVYTRLDGKNHSVICSEEGCGYKVESEAHDDGGKINCVCKDCEGEMDHVAGAWKLYPSDKTKHFEQCTVCYKTLKTAAHEFSYTDINETYHEPVCDICAHKTEWEKHADAEGDGDCLCDNCGHAMAHTDRSKMTYVEAKAPTCEEDGNTDYYHCAECGGDFLSDGSAWDPVLDALGHNYLDKGLTYVEVLGKDIEMHAMQCEYCGRIRTFYHNDSTGDCLCDIEGCGKLAHSHSPIAVQEKEATCLSAGHQAYWKYACGKMFSDAACTQPLEAVEVYPVTDHDWSDWTADGEEHIRECEFCGETESGEHADQWGDRRCDVCEVELELEAVEGKAATCEEAGWEPYWQSSYTGYKYADEDGNVRISEPVAIPALGHKETGWVDEGGEYHKMTCQREGCDWIEREEHSGENDCYCEVCGGYYEGHQLYLEEMVPATCTNSGTQAYYECECGDKFDLDYNPITAPKAIAQLKHDMDPTVKKDVKENKHYIQCKDCSYKLYENHGMELSDPNKGNYHQWLCECGELKIETHYDKNGDKKCDVCGHNMGTTSTKVEQHDNKTVYTGQSDTVNVHKDWFWNWQELFTPSNSGGSSTTVTESATESNTANSGAATNNGAADNAGNADEEVVAPPAGNESVEEEVITPAAPSVPSASQTNILVQFVSWFLGLFGF